jgi:hypothetical protein
VRRGEMEGGCRVCRSLLIAEYEASPHSEACTCICMSWRPGSFCCPGPSGGLPPISCWARLASRRLAISMASGCMGRSCSSPWAYLHSLPYRQWPSRNWLHSLVLKNTLPCPSSPWLSCMFLLSPCMGPGIPCGSANIVDEQRSRTGSDALGEPSCPDRLRPSCHQDLGRTRHLETWLAPVSQRVPIDY